MEENLRIPLLDDTVKGGRVDDGEKEEKDISLGV